MLYSFSISHLTLMRILCTTHAYTHDCRTDSVSASFSVLPLYYITLHCRAFLEISVDEMLGLVEAEAPRWEEVYYVINFHTSSDMDR